MGLLQPHGRSRRLLRRNELTATSTGTAGVPPACGRDARGPHIVVHALAHAVAALSAGAEAGRAVTLLSAPDAGNYAGPGWWREVVAAARAAVPEAKCTAILDCGDDPGAAQAAIRAGVEAILFTGRSDVAERLADIARQGGARLLTRRPAPALDLEGSFFASADVLQRRCRDFLTAR
jgi:hypothetical protein